MDVENRFRNRVAKCTKSVPTKSALDATPFSRECDKIQVSREKGVASKTDLVRTDLGTGWS